MKILQLCNKPPQPATDGGCLAMDSIAQGLLDAGHHVRVLSIATHKHPDRRSVLSPEYLEATSFETVFVDTRVRLISAALNLLGEASYNIERFNSARFRERLIAVLRTDAFDMVQLESLYMMPYLADIRRNTTAKIIYRAHNIEHQIWDRMAAGARGFRQTFMQLLARRLEAYEVAHVNSADGVAAITGADVAQLQRMGCIRPIIHLPYVLPLEDLRPEAPNNVFFHLGAMDWEPNREAVHFMVERIWPLIHVQRPAAVLRLGGRNMPQDYVSGGGIRVDGEVADAKAYMRESGILLAPLLSGGGMRVKLVEAMAMGRAVVSTSWALRAFRSRMENTRLLQIRWKPLLRRRSACTMMRRGGGRSVRPRSTFSWKISIADR